MNLLARINGGLVLLLVLFLASCDEEETAPLDIQIDNATEVLSETISSGIFTVYVDSMRTDSEANVAVGKYTKDQIGTVTAKSYHNFLFEEGSIVSDSAVFDSLVLQMDITGRFTDGERGGKFYIYELEDEIFNSVVYLADKEITTAAIPTDSINPLFAAQNDTISRIHLDNFGQRLFETVRDSASLVGFGDSFGFIPSADVKSLFTFNTRSNFSKLFLYTSVDTIQSTTVFTLDTKHFTNLNRDFSGTSFAGVKNLDSVKIDEENTLLSPLYGFYPVIDIRELSDFVQTDDDLVINKSQISINMGDPTVQQSESVEFFFYDINKGYSGEGLLGAYNDWIRTAILENQAYFPPRPSNITAKAREDEGVYTVDATIFTDVFFRQFRSEEEILTEYLIINPEILISTDETYFFGRPDLNILYTRIRQ